MSGSLKESIAKHRSKTGNGGQPSPLNGIVEEVVRELLPELLSDERLTKLIGEVVTQKLRGPEGKAGRDGMGYIGPRGPKGEDGKSVRGVPGDRGDMGPMPIAGVHFPIPKDGSPDSPEEIRDKIQSLKGKDRLDKSAIKGLDETISGLTRSIGQRGGGGGGGGGGMGKVLHERFPVTSASTTASTSAKIAGSGFALWAFYNGQNIMRGTHYTVGGNLKTLTFLFTPDDGSNFVDIIYVRA